MCIVYPVDPQAGGWSVPQPVGGASYPPLPMPHPLPTHQAVPPVLLPPPPPDQLMVSYSPTHCTSNTIYEPQ